MTAARVDRESGATREVLTGGWYPTGRPARVRPGRWGRRTGPYDLLYRKDVLEYDLSVLQGQSRRTGGGPAGDFTDIEAFGEDRWLGELADRIRRKTYRVEALLSLFDLLSEYPEVLERPPDQSIYDAVNIWRLWSGVE
jgi:hypothetical protein